MLGVVVQARGTETLYLILGMKKRAELFNVTPTQALVLEQCFETYNSNMQSA